MAGLAKQMAVEGTNVSALARLLSYLKMIPGGWKALMGSATGLGAIGTGIWAGSEILGQLGAWGQRGVARKELELQEKLAGAQTEAAKRLTQESRESTKEQMQMLLGEKAKERQEAREGQLMQTYMTGQQQQMEMILAAMQGAAATSGLTAGPSSSEPSVGGGGIASILRSNL